MFSTFVYAEKVPDPTFLPPPPPVIKGGTGVFVPGKSMDAAPVSQELTLKGKLVIDNLKKDSKNKAFFNGSSYFVGDIVNGTYKVKSIDKNQVVLYDIELKKTKIFKEWSE